MVAGGGGASGVSRGAGGGGCGARGGAAGPRPGAGGHAGRMFAAGGLAGAGARTATAPLDRVKLLFQVQAMAAAGTGGRAYTGLGQAFSKILREEGALAFWKGNGTNIVRIFPYSAAQLAANDQYKRFLADGEGRLGVGQRLTAGACAGMTATALTHPLDTVRLRLALPRHPYSGLGNALWTITRTEGPLALYRGLVPTLGGIAPYAALNFASYDLLKAWAYDGGGREQNAIGNLGLGAVAGTFAASVCYPLDTVRRRMQMPGLTYDGPVHALRTIWRTEGPAGYYRGWLANTLKVVPQNAIRFVAYEFLKKLLSIERAKSDT